MDGKCLTISRFCRFAMPIGIANHKSILTLMDVLELCFDFLQAFTLEGFRSQPRYSAFNEFAFVRYTLFFIAILYCMLLGRGWSGTLKRVMWYFEEGGVVL